MHTRRSASRSPGLVPSGISRLTAHGTISTMATDSTRCCRSTQGRRSALGFPARGESRWNLLGPADNVTALAADNGKLFAATRDNKLWARETVGDAPWELVGHANDVVAMTALNGKLYAATSDSKLWMREPLLREVSWQHIGHANGVVAMAAAGGRLYAVTGDETLWQRDPVSTNVDWQAIGNAKDVAGLAVM
jgi:hypothetical protein